MESLSLKTIAQYLSIQEGFVWSDIPRFSIITGVNGVGKTQLLQLFNGLGKDSAEFTSQNGNKAKLVFADSIKKELSIEGLIQYKKESLSRMATIKEHENSILWSENQNRTLEERKREISDRVEQASIEQQIRNNKINIDYHQKEVNRLVIYAYENELSQLCRYLGKEVDELTDEDIRNNTNPYFNPLTEIEDLSLYIKQEEDIRNGKFIALSKEGRESEIRSIREEERSFEAINRLFQRYGFSYFEMLDPFPIDKSRSGEVIFKGKKNEIVSFNALSSGEQMIVKFIMWAMGRDVRGRRINTMVVDEPDAHLHPSMCKMMVEIFEEISRPKEEGGSDIRIIITTHSPSTVAFAPKGSLFVMEKDEKNDRHIRPTESEEAVRVLSDGIFTYDKALHSFRRAFLSEKRNLLFVEGKTDAMHLSKAMMILGYDLDVDIIDMHDAGSLAGFIKSTPSKLFGGKKMIALFDNDAEGRSSYGGIKGDESSLIGAKVITAEQCEGRSFALLIQAPSLLGRYCPIEFLYPLSYLKRNQMISKRAIQEYQTLYKANDPVEAEKLLEVYKTESDLRPFIAVDNNKVLFATSVEHEIDCEVFQGFVSTLELIKRILLV